MIVETRVRDPLAGRTVDGRYRIDALIARGGMATVFEATDLRLDRTVAVKVMHRSLAEDPGFVSRFEREARSAARLSHPNVVSVYDQGEDDGLVFLVMEYVHGRTVRDVLREHGTLSPAQALVVLEPVLEALSAAHRAGFVHRDVKPENVLIADDGRVKVADFGLARAIAASTTTAATQGVLIGTVAYLSPEQVERGIADPRSDVYGAGILLYEMLTGSVPHAGETPLAVAYQHVNADVPVASAVRSDVPPVVDDLVRVATRRDPDDRYHDAAAFLAAIRAARAQLPDPAPFAVPRDTLVVLHDGEAITSPVAANGRATTGAAAGAATRARSGRGGTRAADPRAGGSAPAPPPPGAVRQRRRWPRVLALLVVLSLVAGVSSAAWYLGSARWVSVPGVVGLDEAGAGAKLHAADLTLEVSSRAFSETVPAGQVISTDPAGGAQARKGSSVSAVVSQGPERFAVPSVAGQSVTDATSLLSDNSLRVGATRKAYDEKIARGLVVASDPKAGQLLKRDTAVTLVVSAGPRPVPVPAVRGKDADTVQHTLEGLGFTVTRTEKYSDTVSTGQVISSSPPAGRAVARGSTVALVVSLGPPPVQVPNVVDKDRATAISILTAAGLQVRVEEPLGVTPLNRVLRQSPDGGQTVPQGSTVTIQIV